MARGDRVLTVPKDVAEKIDTDYLAVEFVDGRLTYTPVQISEAL